MMQTISPPILRISHYRVITEIGIGGMGRVLKAVDNKLGREVAIKVLRQDLAEDKKIVEYFMREAQAAASIDHPNVVKIFECGIEENQPFLVMELLKGKSLQLLLHDLEKIPEPMALSIITESAEGLEAATKLGLVHGDIHPGNLYIDEERGVKLLDFGLANIAYHQTFKEDGIIGAVAYVSPERVKGEPEDLRSDIFSLGVTFYQILSGKKPFQDPDPKKLLQKRITERAPQLVEICPQVHRETSDIIHRMMDPDPAKRYGTYAELIKDLKTTMSTIVLKGPDKAHSSKAALNLKGNKKRPAKIKTQPVPEPKVTGKKGSPPVWVVTVLTLLIVVGAVTAIYLQHKPEAPTRKVVTPPPAAKAAPQFVVEGIDLTTEGRVDWIHWGLNKADDVNRKKEPSRKISTISVVGMGSLSRFNDASDALGWSDGTPSEKVSKNTAGVFIEGEGNGFEITVPASKTPYKLNLYLGLSKSKGRLELGINDGSEKTVTHLESPDDALQTVVPLTFKAREEGKTFTVRWTVEKNFDPQGKGTVGLQAATLQQADKL